MKLVGWEKFLEAKKTGEMPPLNGKKAPDFGPHAKNDGKTILRVAEKNKDDALGDKASPVMKNAKDCCSLGRKPDYKSVVAEALKVNEKIKKPIVRGTEKDKQEPLTKKGCPCFKKPEDVQTLGVKAVYTDLNTEEFVEKTAKLSDSEFIQAMVSEEFGGEETNIEPVHCALTGRTAFPSAHEAARYMAKLLPENARARRLLIDELKSNPKGMSTLMSELVGHDDTYNEMVNQIGLGETKVARKFVKAMQDNHEKFMTEMGLLTGVSESVNAPLTQRSFGKPPQHDEPAPEQDDMPMDDMPPDEQEPEGQEVMQDQPGDGTDSVNQVQNTPAAKLNKEFAYHHMVKEMAKFPNQLDAMKGCMKND